MKIDDEYVPMLFVLVASICIGAPMVLSAPRSGSTEEGQAVAAWLSGELTWIAIALAIGAVCAALWWFLTGRRGRYDAYDETEEQVFEVEHLLIEATPQTRRIDDAPDGWETVVRALEKELGGNTYYLDPSYARRGLLQAVAALKAQVRARTAEQDELLRLRRDYDAALAALRRRDNEGITAEAYWASRELQAQRTRHVIAIARHWRKVAREGPEQAVWADALTLLLDSDSASVNGLANGLRAGGFPVSREAIAKGGPLSQLAALKRSTPSSPTGGYTEDDDFSEGVNGIWGRGAPVNGPVDRVNGPVNEVNGPVNDLVNAVNDPINSVNGPVNGPVNAVNGRAGGW